MNALESKIASIKQLAEEAQALLASAVNVVNVNVGATLQPIIDAAPDHSVLALEAGSYVGTLSITKPLSITTRREIAEGRAVDADVRIIGGDQAIRVLGDHIALHGIGMQSMTPLRNIVEVTGLDFMADRCVVLGSPTVGAHRGFMLNGNGALLTGCYVDDCFLMGQEAQAVAMWDGSRHIVIDDCYLGGAAQSVLSGGSDSLAADRIPTDITIMRSTLAKKAGWAAKGAMVKTAFELKAAIGVHMFDCELQGAGTSGSQGAYLIVLKSANQGGRAPWSQTNGVLIERCWAHDGGGCVSFVGQDGANPAGKMSNVTIRDVKFTNIDGTLGRGRGFEFQSAPSDVTIKDVTAEMRNMQADMYFSAPVPPRLILQNIKGILPKTSLYGIKIDGAGTTPLQQWAPDALINITPTDTGAHTGV